MKTEFTAKEMETLVAEMRPIATRMAQDIAELANSHPIENAGCIAGLLSSLVIQTITTTMAINLHEPGSREGEAMIIETYEAAKQDALARWHKKDLKIHFATKNRPN